MRAQIGEQLGGFLALRRAEMAEGTIPVGVKAVQFTYRSLYIRGLGLFLALAAFHAACSARIIPRRDPLDGALDATLIVMMRPLSPDLFQVEEVFLGDVAKGQSLALPGFSLTVEDDSAMIRGTERIEPIHESTRILVFLKPAAPGVPKERPRGAWIVAGYGNCYFWSHDPDKVDSLRAMAANALALRKSWQAARDLPDERQRVAALWPFLWDHNYACHRQTEATLETLGPIAGDYIAARLPRMTHVQKGFLLGRAGAFGGPRLHTAVIDELKEQQVAWEALLRRHGRFAAWDEIVNPGRGHSPERTPQEAEIDEDERIYGVLYEGLEGLGGFNDRADLPYIRELALWGVRYRFKQVADAALEAFIRMPDEATSLSYRPSGKSFRSGLLLGTSSNQLR